MNQTEYESIFKELENKSVSFGLESETCKNIFYMTKNAREAIGFGLYVSANEFIRLAKDEMIIAQMKLERGI